MATEALTSHPIFAEVHSLLLQTDSFRFDCSFSGAAYGGLVELSLCKTVAALVSHLQPVKVCTDLRTLTLRESTLAFEHPRLHWLSKNVGAWAPNLNVFVSHLSTPGLTQEGLHTLPPSLETAIYSVRLCDLTSTSATRLPAAMKLFHVIVLGQATGADGTFSRRDCQLVGKLRKDLQA